MMRIQFISRVLVFLTLAFPFEAACFETAIEGRSAQEGGLEANSKSKREPAVTKSSPQVLDHEHPGDSKKPSAIFRCSFSLEGGQHAGYGKGNPVSQNGNLLFGLGSGDALHGSELCLCLEAKGTELILSVF